MEEYVDPFIFPRSISLARKDWRTVPYILLAILSLQGNVASGNDAAKPGLNGTAGIGPIMVPRYTGGKSSRTLLVPLVSAAYNDTYRLDLDRGTAYFFSTADKKMGFGLAAEPRYGFHASSGSRLAGMARRRDSLEGGPSIGWETPLADLSVSYFGDLTGVSHGTSLYVSVSKDFIATERWACSAVLEINQISAKTANYYFGVSEAEVTPSRPFFRPTGGTIPSVGLDGSYKLNKDYSLVFGTIVSRLNGAIAASPIVEERTPKIFWLGFAWNL